MPKQMRVIEVAPAKEGGRPSLKLAKRDLPTLGSGQVLIEVVAAGVNRADLAQRAGGYPPPPGASDLLGLEVSGRIAALGDAVPPDAFTEGQEVCALLAGGGYAGYAAVDHRHVLPIPQGIDLVTAAGVMETFATAWLNLWMEAAARPGERILVHAAGSGVGTAAVQLCRMQGNPCMATAGSAAKLDMAAELGAEATALRGEDMFEAVKAWGPVDVALDPVGAAYLGENLDCLARDGRLVLIGLLGGAASEISLATLLIKRIRLIGSTLRNRDPDAKAELVRQLRELVWPRFADGTLRVVVDRVYPFAEAEQAHLRMAQDANLGKIILSLRE